MAIDDLHLKIIALNKRALSIPPRLLEKRGYQDWQLRPEILQWCGENAVKLQLHYVSNLQSTFRQDSLVIAKFNSVDEAFEFKMRWF